MKEVTGYSILIQGANNKLIPSIHRFKRPGDARNWALRTFATVKGIQIGEHYSDDSWTVYETK